MEELCENRRVTLALYIYKSIIGSDAHKLNCLCLLYQLTIYIS